MINNRYYQQPALVVNIMLFILLLTVTIAGCGPKEAQKEAALTVSAAASLQDVMTEIKEIYAQESKTVITYNFGASGALQKQIEQGAPVDVFISAAVQNMDGLEKKGLLLNDTRRDLLSNEVVLIVPRNSELISCFQDLVRNEVKTVALGEASSVPAGKYAQQVLTKLNLWGQIQGKTVLAKDVRQVLNYVETENAEAGIVYKTDALVSSKVKIASEAPAGSYTLVLYPVAVLKESKQQKAARDFVAFLSGDKARAVFEKYGFKTTGR